MATARSTKGATDHAAKHELARYLESLAPAKLRVSFDPTGSFFSDPESRGHLFSGFLSDDDEEDCFTLDDRLPQPIEEQLASELRRIGKVYSKLAKSILAEHETRRKYAQMVAQDPRAAEKKSLAKGAA